MSRRLRSILFRHRKALQTLSLFFLIVTIRSLLSCQGVDLTDEGYHLSNQWALCLGSSHSNPLLLGSNLLGSWWLGLLSAPNLAWARLGGAIWQGGCATFVFIWLERDFGPRAWLVVLSTSLLISAYLPCGLNYDSVPAGLGLIWLFLWQRMQQPNHKTAFALGAMAGLLTFCRIPLLLLAFVPLFFGFLGWFPRKHWPTYFLGLLLSLCAGLSIWLTYSHAPALRGAIVSHSLSSLIVGYLRDAGRILAMLALLAPVAYLVSAESKKLPEKQISIERTIFLLYLATLTALLFNRALQIKLAHGVALLVIGLVTASVIYHIRKAETSSLRGFLAASILFPWALAAGSDNGLFKIVFGLSYVLPRQALTIPPGWGWRRGWVVLSLFPIAMFLLWVQIYRDNPDRFQLVIPFRCPSLAGIHSTSTRTKVIDEAYFYAARELRPGEPLLTGVMCPLMGFILNTRPWPGESTWAIAFEKDDMRKQLRATLLNDRPPRMVLIQKGDTIRDDWPNTPDISDYNRILQDRFQVVSEELFSRYDYRLVWQNEGFCIYRRSNG